MYDRQGFEPPPLTPDVTESQQAHTSDTAVRLVTYAVAAALVLLVGLWWHSQEDGGFGISGDLFDRSAESDRDPPLPTDEETGTAAAGLEPDGESIAMTPHGLDEWQQGNEALAEPTVADPASGAEADVASAATEPTNPRESFPSEEPTAAAPAGDAATGDLASTDAAAAQSRPSRNEEPAVTAPVEESTPGQMDAVVPAPSDPGVTQSTETSATQESTAETEADSTVGADPGTETSTGDTAGDDARAPDEAAGSECRRRFGRQRLDPRCRLRDGAVRARPGVRARNRGSRSTTAGAPACSSVSCRPAGCSDSTGRNRSTSCSDSARTFG